MNKDLEPYKVIGTNDNSIEDEYPFFEIVIGVASWAVLWNEHALGVGV